MKIDLVPELPLSGDYQNIATAMDVFSRFLLAYPKTNQDAKLVARVKLNIVTKHAYMLTTIISHEGSAFLSDLHRVNLLQSRLWPLWIHR